MMKRGTPGALAVVLGLWAAPSASADTATIGAAAPPGAASGGVADFAVIQTQTDPASPSFVVPPVPAGGGPWSVTSWGARGGDGAGSAAIEIWRPTSTSGEFRLIAVGPQQPFPAGVLTTHSVNIPVLPGDHLGVVSGPDADFRSNYVSSLSGDIAIWSTPPTNPAVGQTMGAPSSDISHSGGTQNRANVQATLTSTPVVATPPPNANTKKKCKKKKHKRSAESAKKKKCKKRKKH